VRAEIEDVDLGQLFGRLEQAWGLQAAEQGLNLRVRPTRLVVRSDVALLGRIVGNLISNAIRYTRDGSVLLAARQRGDRCVLQVWDTGPGIAPGFRESIFEEFFRIDTPGAAKSRGLGLGLSIVRRGAQILDHGLRVDSRVGHGSVFELDMPLSTNGIAETGIGADDGDAIEEIEGAFVVIVDDDESNRLALANVLLNWRCHVIASASADEALAKSTEHLRMPDLIITDFRLEDGCDGFNVIRRLRAHHQEPIPALMLTANTDGTLAAQAKLASALLLHKPVGGQRLLQAVLQAMRAAAAD
jgi:CheY-like chemotaxis protein